MYSQSSRPHSAVLSLTPQSARPLLSIREPAGHSLKIVLVVVLVLGLYLPKKTEDENETSTNLFIGRGAVARHEKPLWNLS